MPAARPRQSAANRQSAPARNGRTAGQHRAQHEDRAARPAARRARRSARAPSSQRSESTRPVARPAPPSQPQIDEEGEEDGRARSGRGRSGRAGAARARAGAASAGRGAARRARGLPRRAGAERAGIGQRSLRRRRARPPADAGMHARDPGSKPALNIRRIRRDSAYHQQDMDTAARPARVLVVEDDDEIAQVLQRSLRMEGYEVKLAADGVRGARGGARLPPRPDRARPRACRGSTASTSPSGCARTATRSRS